ncbi:unnamed protein product [Meganyctiphanes norvegica]|uniref:E3 ubiquitin-protein ligase n=1 Tax=Meganyctiphanes norvegica TaxID=48144 RepID=A0AAV2QQ46_MEGNR
MKQDLEDIVAEGNDIVKGLEALQDRVRSANSLLGFNMASQDVQKYYMASQEWVTSRVESILKENIYSSKEEIVCSKKIVSQGVTCQREIQVGELLYSCLQCRKKASIVLCGSCFVNSGHLKHKVEIQQAVSDASCDCGLSELWKRESICRQHLRNDESPLRVYDARLQLLSKCKEVFFKGDKLYTCLDCRRDEEQVLCGSCFLNSSHKDHRYESPLI